MADDVAEPGPQARIGVVSWKKPQWRGGFYPPGMPQARELGYISDRMRTLEVDTTFYGLKPPSNFLAWRDEVPDDFVFSVKAIRTVTHVRRLEGVAGDVAEFFASGVLFLQEKLGPILWQVPETLRFRPRTVEDFLRLLPRSVDEARRFAARHGFEITPAQLALPDRPIRYALEARNSGFGGNPRFLELLRRYDVAAVVTNSREWPVIDAVTSDFVYVRLHADMTQFADGYDEETLEWWAARIADWVAGEQDGIGRDVFVYFDNSGFAGTRSPFDAVRLQELVGWSPSPRQALWQEDTLF